MKKARPFLSKTSLFRLLHAPQDGSEPTSACRVGIFPCFQAAAPHSQVLLVAARELRTPRFPESFQVSTCARPPQGPLAPRPWTPRRRPASALVDAIVGGSVRPATSPRAINGDCVSLSGPPFSSYFLTLPLELQSPLTRSAAAAARVRAFRRALDLTVALRPRGASQVGGGVVGRGASARARAAGGRRGGVSGCGAAAEWPDLPGAVGAPRGWCAGGWQGAGQELQTSFFSCSFIFAS